MDLYDIIKKNDFIELLANLHDPFDNRGSLRTHYFAYSFIKLALKYPNEKIYVYDHHTTKVSDAHYIADRIKSIVYSYDFFTVDMERHGKRKMYIQYSPIDVNDYKNRDELWELICENFYYTLRN